MKEKIIGTIAGLLFWAYYKTLRYRVHFAHGEKKQVAYKFSQNVTLDPQSNIILATWHQEMVATMGHFQNQNITVLASQSKDGSILSTAIGILGFRTIRGSSSRGGVKALLSAIAAIKKGHCIAIAPDGPRGPRFKLKEGVIKLSEKTGRPIVPICAHPRSYISEKSWSQIKLPLPFSTIDLYFGEPGYYTAQELEQALLTLGRS